MCQKYDLPKQNWETVEYANNPDLPDVEDLRIVDKEFLPRPEELVYKDTETENITVSLDKKTATFFKSKAKELGASHQTLIRSILKEYVARQSR